MKEVLCRSTFNFTSIHDLKYLLARMVVSYELGTLAIQVNLPYRRMLIPHDTSTDGKVRLICTNVFRINSINY